MAMTARSAARIGISIVLSMGPPAAQPAAPPRDPRSELPLVVTAVTIETGPPLPDGVATARVDVRNQGKVAILAWGVRFELLLPDGTTKTHGFSTDSAHTASGPHRSEIAPGSTASFPRTPSGVHVSPQATGGPARATFVIFADDTALGDEREIAFIFEQRRDRQTFWHAIDAIFKQVTARESDPAAVLGLLRQRLESEHDPAFRRGGFGWYDEILARMSERRMNMTRRSPQDVMESLRRTIAEQKALCDTHLQRRR
jgi:hypothetical protein